MTITINGAFIGQAMTGVQRYSYEICRRLTAMSDTEACPKVDVIARSSDRHAVLAPRITAFRRLPQPAWSQIVLPFYVDDVLLSLGNIGSVAVRNQILCIHDANIKIVPHSYSVAYVAYHNMMMPLLGIMCRTIATVSTFSADSLVKYGITKANKIQIIGNGHEHVFQWDAGRSRLTSFLSGRRPFVFILGSRAVHKNIHLILDLASEIDKIGLDILIAGEGGGKFRDVLHSNEIANVVFLGRVSDDDLALLYGEARALLFPSFTEGFGIPILEAMALGCPVITSNTSSLPEVGGDCVLYADPCDPATWLNQLKRLQESRALQDDLSRAGLERSRLFSWENAARRYAELAAAM